MTWSNLYSTESKYKLSLKSSAHARIWLFCQCLMLVFVLSYSLSLIVNMAVFYLVVAVFLFGLLIFILSELTLGGGTQTSPEYFTLDLSGYCQFGLDDIWLLTKASKLSFWGCYLTLEKIDPLTQKVLEPKIQKRRFIFKDSMNKQDYARLCRVILKNKNEKQALDVKQ